MCEKCWRDAAMRVMLCGGSQVHRYEEILREREDNPCSTSEQRGETIEEKSDAQV